MSWNAFKLCTALRALGYIMVLVVLAIVGLTYCAVVFANYLPALLAGGFDVVSAFFLLILFHFLLVMLLWSYFYVVITDPGGVPLNWRPEIDEEGGHGAPLVQSEYGGVGGLVSNQSVMAPDPSNRRVRFCRKCNHFNPPRCHHCSVWECILKIDHHCVWVVNCVGALNYKYFLLFLISGTLGTVAASFITFILNLAFALSVLGFMVMHLLLVASNTTTIEAYEKKTTPKWHYDLGRKKNFEQVFGTDKWYWFIPAYSEEDLRWIPALQGIDYSTRPELHALQQL